MSHCAEKQAGLSSFRVSGLPVYREIIPSYPRYISRIYCSADTGRAPRYSSNVIPFSVISFAAISPT